MFPEMVCEGEYEYFIYFFDIDSQASYCWGWKEGENTYDGVKLEIEIIRDD